MANVNIQVTATTAQAVAEMTKFLNTTQNGLAGLKNTALSLQTLAPGIAALFGGHEILQMAKEAVGAMKNMAQFEQVLRASGVASEDLRRRLEKQREELSKTTVQDDDAILTVQRRLLQYGATADSIERLTRLTLDYAAAQGMDASTAAMMFGRAISGGDFALRGMRLTIDTTLPKAEQLAQAMEQLDKRIGGAAATSFQQAAPAFQQFQKDVEDTRKELGKLLLPALIEPFVKGISNGLENLMQWLKNAKKEFPGLILFVQQASSVLGEFAGKTLPVTGALTIGITTFAALAAAARILDPLLKAVNVEMVLLRGVTMATVVELAILAATLLKLIELLNEWNKLNSANKAVESSWDKLIAQRTQLRVALETNIQQLMKEGKVTQEWGKETQRTLLMANKAWIDGTIGVEQYDSLLQKVINRLKAFQGTGAAPAPVEPPLSKKGSEVSEAFSQANLAAALGAVKSLLEVQKSLDELEEQQLKDKFDQQLISAKSFYDAKRSMIKNEGAMELEALRLQDSQLKAQAAKLQEELNKLLSIPEAERTPENQNAILAATAKVGSAMASQSELAANIQKTQNGITKELFAQDTLEKDSTKNNVKKLDMLQEQRKQIELSKLQGMAQGISGDPFLSAMQKRPMLLENQAQQMKLITSEITSQSQKLLETNRTEEEKLQINQRIITLQQQQAELMNQQKTLSAENTFFGNMRLGLVQLRSEWEDFNKGLATVGLNAIRLSVQGVSESIEEAIDQTGTWGAVWTNVLKQIRNSLIQFVVQWIISKTVIAGLENLFGEQSGKQSAIAAAKSSAIWAAPAMLRSIAELGPIGGPIAYAADLTLGYGLAAGAGVAGAGAAAREFGGPVEAGRPYIVGERRPELFIPSVPGVIMPNVPSAASVSNGTSSGSQRENTPVRIVIVDNRPKAEDMKHDAAIRTAIVEMVKDAFPRHLS